MVRAAVFSLLAACGAEAAQTFGPGNCVALDQSEKGTCTLQTNCQGQDLAGTAFMFICQHGKKRQMHSFGQLKTSEFFDSGIKCDSCNLAPPVKRPGDEPAKGEAFLSQPSVAAYYGPQHCVLTYNYDKWCIVETRCQGNVLEQTNVGLTCVNHVKEIKWNGQTEEQVATKLKSAKARGFYMWVDEDGTPMTQWSASVDNLKEPLGKTFPVEEKLQTTEHFFGKNSFEARETFNTLVQCDRCLGVPDGSEPNMKEVQTYQEQQLIEKPVKITEEVPKKAKEAKVEETAAKAEEAEALKVEDKLMKEEVEEMKHAKEKKHDDHDHHHDEHHDHASEKLHDKLHGKDAEKAEEAATKADKADESNNDDDVAEVAAGLSEAPTLEEIAEAAAAASSVDEAAEKTAGEPAQTEESQAVEPVKAADVSPPAPSGPTPADQAQQEEEREEALGEEEDEVIQPVAPSIPQPVAPANAPAPQVVSTGDLDPEATAVAFSRHVSIPHLHSDLPALKTHMQDVDDEVHGLDSDVHGLGRKMALMAQAMDRMQDEIEEMGEVIQEYESEDSSEAQDELGADEVWHQKSPHPNSEPKLNRARSIFAQEDEQDLSHPEQMDPEDRKTLLLQNEQEAKKKSWWGWLTGSH